MGRRSVIYLAYTSTVLQTSMTKSFVISIERNEFTLSS